MEQDFGYVTSVPSFRSSRHKQTTNAVSGAYLQTQVQIFLIADSGAIHTNVTQAHVCKMWTLAHIFLNVLM